MIDLLAQVIVEQAWVALGVGAANEVHVEIGPIVDGEVVFEAQEALVAVCDDIDRAFAAMGMVDQPMER